MWHTAAVLSDSSWAVVWEAPWCWGYLKVRGCRWVTVVHTWLAQEGQPVDSAVCAGGDGSSGGGRKGAYVKWMWMWL